MRKYDWIEMIFFTTSNWSFVKIFLIFLKYRLLKFCNDRAQKSCKISRWLQYNGSLTVRLTKHVLYFQIKTYLDNVEEFFKFSRTSFSFCICFIIVGAVVSGTLSGNFLGTSISIAWWATFSARFLRARSRVLACSKKFDSQKTGL